MKRTAFDDDNAPQLAYGSVDPERKFGFPTGKDTCPHPFTSLLLGALIAALLYGVAWMASGSSTGEQVWVALTEYQRIPIAIVLFSCWTAAILFIKWRKIAGQRCAFHSNLMPEDGAFRLNESSVPQVLEHIHSSISDPERLLLVNRIDRVLRNVRNVGRVADIDEMFASAADADEARMESSYTVVRGLIWAIPVLGFIGTIVGLTIAIGEFAGVLDISGGDKAELTSQLGEVISGLNTAFITTGEGLVAALVLHLGMVSIRRLDESLLDDIRSFCTTRVLSIVRLDRSE